MKYLIVGQGLAGTLLAHQFEEHGIDYTIIDRGNNESSRIAAGIINPIVFRRVTKSWLVDECMEELVPCYQRIEQKLGVTFLFSRTIRRAFSSEQEVESWEKKSAESSFSKYITLPKDKIDAPEYLNAPFGNGTVNNVYYVDTKLFIDSNKAYFIRKGVYVDHDIDYNTINETGYVLGGNLYSHIVFCEGYRNIYNPYFNHLPINSTKGQVLDLEVFGTIPKSEILNRKCFLLQLDNNVFKAGATYEWNTPDTLITEEAKTDLETKIAHLIPFSFNIIHQEAGIRPTTLDRRPIMGQHPVHNHLYIFNGLGTKGYMLGPLMAKQFVAYIRNGDELNKEVKISRFI